MPTLDLAMPIALFIVVVVAMLLNKRVEGRLMSTVEQKEFKTRDVIILIVFMAIVISGLAYTAMLNPGEVFQNILLVIFLSSYTMLLFTFSYIFSNLRKIRAQLLSVGFGIASLITGISTLLAPLADTLTPLRAVSFFSLAAFCFVVAGYVQQKETSKERWYVAVQPPAMFILLFVFFNFIHNTGTAMVWAPYLMDVFGFTFAILIILYLSSLFSWKTVGLFAVLLTTMDIILVLGSSAMITAANTFTGLGLPVLIALPQVPLLETAKGLAFRGLGLGDFFFAGVLAVQTFNKFGKKTALMSAVAMAIAFGIWEAFLQDILAILNPIAGRNIGGFPGTLMIISGWAPVVAVMLLMRRSKPAPPSAAEPVQPIEPTEAPKTPDLPPQ